MTHVNLLPWRDALKRQRQQNYWLALGGGIGLTMVIMFGVYQVFAQQLDYQQRRNLLWQQDLDALELQVGEIRDIQKQVRELEGHIQLISQLDRSRSQATRILEQLADMAPPGLYLSSLKRSKSGLDLDGQSESSKRVSQLLRRVNEDGVLFSSSELHRIVADKQSPRTSMAFAMQIQLANQGDTDVNGKP